MSSWSFDVPQRGNVRLTREQYSINVSWTSISWPSWPIYGPSTNHQLFINGLLTDCKLAIKLNSVLGEGRWNQKKGMEISLKIMSFLVHLLILIVPLLMDSSVFSTEFACIKVNFENSGGENIVFTMLPGQ